MAVTLIHFGNFEDKVDPTILELFVLKEGHAHIGILRPVLEVKSNLPKHFEFLLKSQFFHPNNKNYWFYINVFRKIEPIWNLF